MKSLQALPSSSLCRRSSSALLAPYAREEMGLGIRYVSLTRRCGWYKLLAFFFLLAFGGALAERSMVRGGRRKLCFVGCASFGKIVWHSSSGQGSVSAADPQRLTAVYQLCQCERQRDQPHPALHSRLVYLQQLVGIKQKSENPLRTNTGTTYQVVHTTADHAIQHWVGTEHYQVPGIPLGLGTMQLWQACLGLYNCSLILILQANATRVHACGTAVRRTSTCMCYELFRFVRCGASRGIRYLIPRGTTAAVLSLFIVLYLWYFNTGTYQHMLPTIQHIHGSVFPAYAYSSTSYWYSAV